MKKTFLLATSILFYFFSYSQQNPNSLKWYEINSKNAKIIFPKGFENEAQKAANLIDYIYPLETKTLKKQPKKIPLIIYNQSTTSNAFVGLRPWRSAWYITPSQYAADLGTEDWFYLLASHEYRHAVQYTTSNQHFTKFMNIMFGETGILMGQYSYPFWYFEGDAVCMETALSDNGRGRLPQFDMGIRTMILSNKNVSYDLAKFRSYKTFYPDHYKLGWLLTSYAREKYGADIWNKTIETSSKYSFWPYAFSLALKHHTGLNEQDLYYNAMESLDSAWTEKTKDLKVTDAKIINNSEKKSWTKYTEVNFIDDDNFIVKKGSMKSDITTFYMIDKNGNEHKIKPTDAGIISTSNGKVVWARQYPDPRWQLRNYSDIVILDINTKKEKRLTKKQKFFAPALSPDGKMIAVVELKENRKSSLVILDSKTGNEIYRYEDTDDNFYRTPSWDNKNQKVVFTRSNGNGTVLSIYDIKTNSVKDIGKKSDENIGRPVFYKNFILYNSPFNGIGNIYAINIDTNERFQITSRKFGAYNPKVKNDRMVFIDYSVDGYDIAEVNLKDIKWKSIGKVKNVALNTANIIQKQEQNKNMLKPNLIPNKEFEVKKYNKLKDAFKVHSWGMYIVPPETFTEDDEFSFEPEIGFSIYTANILNTLYSSLNASYNFNEEAFNSYATVLFKKYYPTFSLSGGWAERNVMYSTKDDVTNTRIFVNDNWDEYYSSLNTNIPLNFSSGIYYRGANIGATYTYINRTDKDYRYFDESGNGDFSTLGYYGSIYAFRHQATQDINPKFGYFLYAKYQDTPFNTDIYGHQFSFLSSFYLPGFAKHHSLNFKLNYEKQRSDINSDYYWFESPISFPRGQDYFAYSELKTFNVNYSLPVWYPDINFGPLAFFKRVRANIFYDYAIANNFNEDITLNSVGAELFIQMHVFRLGLPIEIGGRISYLDDGTFVPEFLMLSIPF
ncbi:MAG: hypothetical protein GXO49_07190 [Chlorobi bacterium]|nr:hypothetical protein [Chlorobiota bacterium]